MLLDTNEINKDSLGLPGQSLQLHVFVNQVVAGQFKNLLPSQQHSISEPFRMEKDLDVAQSAFFPFFGVCVKPTNDSRGKYDLLNIQTIIFASVRKKKLTLT